MGTLEIIIVIVASVVLLCSPTLGVVIATKTYLRKKENSTQKNIPIPRDNFHLSFEECNKIIDDITNDIWQNKYFINYRLREVVIIPEMDKEIHDFVTDVYNSIGDRVKLEAMRYYSYEYIIQRITRKGQMLFIEYTNTFKPNTK